MKSHSPSLCPCVWHLSDLGWVLTFCFCPLRRVLTTCTLAVAFGFEIPFFRNWVILKGLPECLFSFGEGISSPLTTCTPALDFFRSSRFSDLCWCQPVTVDRRELRLAVSEKIVNCHNPNINKRWIPRVRNGK